MQEEDDKIFAQNLPKIELHLHLDGSLSPGNLLNFLYPYLFNGRLADTLTSLSKDCHIFAHCGRTAPLKRIRILTKKNCHIV